MNLSVVPDLMQGGASPHAPARALTVGRLAWLVRDVAARPGDWWHLVRLDGVPVRVPVRLPVPAAECELWLSAWPAGYRGDPGADVLAVLAGELTERTITGQGVAERALRANRVRVYGAGHPREIVNLGPALAISLHAISPHVISPR